MRLGTEAGTGDAGGALHLSPEVAVVRPRAEINVGTGEPQQPEPSRRRLPQAPGKAGASGVRCWAPVDRPWRQGRPITPGRCFCLKAVVWRHRGAGPRFVTPLRVPRAPLAASTRGGGASRAATP